MESLEPLLLSIAINLQDPIGLLRELLPMVLAILAALLAARYLLTGGSSKCEVKRYVPHSGHPELKLCGPEVPTLTFFGDQFQRFHDEVKRIYAVDHNKPPFGTGRPDDDCAFVPPCDIKESIRQMRAACADLQEGASGSWRLHEPLDDLLYARNLLAVDFHHARAVQLVRNYVAYRHQHRGGIFPDYAWLKLGIAVLPFEDVMGRPVMIARAKHFDSQTSAETFRCFYRGMVDSIIAHFLLKRRPELDDRNPLEQYVVVLDVRGAVRQNFSMTAIKVMIQESNTYYPDCVAQIFVLGVNMAVRRLWSIVSPMVQPRTRKKTQLITTDEVAPLMRRLVHPEQLTEEYGGRAPDFPAPADARSVAEMAGRVCADTWETLGALRVLQEKTALASKICVAWHMPPFGFRERSSFKLWLQSRGESTAICRDTAECAEFLTDLQHSSDLEEVDLDLVLPNWNEGCWGSWLCGGRAWQSEEEMRSWKATRCPEVYGRVLGKILSESQGAAGRAILDFVSGSGPYLLKRLHY